MTYTENTFFAVKLAHKDSSSNYWHVIRRIKTLPGAKGELLEAIASCMQPDLKNYFFFDVGDFDLSQDFSGLGAKRIGYLSEDLKSNLVINGWGESWRGQVRAVHEVLPTDRIRQNLYILEEISHNLETTESFFRESFFKRDRIYWGITKSSIKWREKTKVLPKLSERKKITDWKELSNSRMSADSFVKKELSQNELEEYLQNTFYKRPDGHFYYGTAGGLECINTYMILQNVSGLENGVYKVNTQENKIDFQSKFDQMSLVAEFLFLPDELASASVFFFFTFNYDELGDKYGQRSIRFSLLNLGGATHQAHLTADSQALKFRVIGGFDELQCSKILPLKSGEYLACAAILGK